MIKKGFTFVYEREEWLVTKVCLDSDGWQPIGYLAYCLSNPWSERQGTPCYFSKEAIESLLAD